MQLKQLSERWGYRCRSTTPSATASSRRLIDASFVCRPIGPRDRNDRDPAVGYVRVRSYRPVDDDAHGELPLHVAPTPLLCLEGRTPVNIPHETNTPGLDLAYERAHADELVTPFPSRVRTALRHTSCRA